MAQLFEEQFRIENEYFRCHQNLTQAKELLKSSLGRYTQLQPELESESLVVATAPSRASRATRELRQLAHLYRSRFNKTAIEDLLSSHATITFSEIQTLPKDLAIALKSFISKYYYIGEGELDLRIPRWCENARLVLVSLKTLMESDNEFLLTEDGQRPSANYEQALQQLEIAHQRSWLHYLPGSLAINIRRLDRVRHLLWIREELRDASLRLYYFIRQFAIELARRKNLAITPSQLSHSPVFYSSHLDLIELASGGQSINAFLERAQQNADYTHGHSQWNVPIEFEETGYFDSEQAVSAFSAHSTSTLQGLSGGAGKVRGRARVITDPSMIGDVKAGDILVTRFADVGWAPLVSLASGMICESGDALSPTAVLSRELSIPSVLNVSRATELISDGQEIEIDGNGGEVYLD
jgi:pyruvate,water dikinase